MTPELQCRLCPALVATAGGDLRLLEEHLHSLHRVAGAEHLQLARAVTLLSRGEVATILAKLGPRLTLLTTTGLLDYNITLIDEDIDDDDECSDSDEEQVEDTHIGDTITVAAASSVVAPFLTVFLTFFLTIFATSANTNPDPDPSKLAPTKNLIK